MGPERSSDGESDEGRLRLDTLVLADPRRGAIGDGLEAAARSRQRSRRWRRAGLGAGAVASAALLVLLVVRARPGVDSEAEGRGTHLRTGTADFQLLSLGDRGVAFVSEETDLERHLGRTPALVVHRGSVRLVVTHHDGEPFVVATDAAEVAVLGTEFDVSVSNQTTSVSVVRGEVEVRNRHGRRRLWPRESARVRPGEAPRMVVPIESLIVDGPAELLEPNAGFPGQGRGKGSGLP